MDEVSQKLLLQWQAGDEQAAASLFRRYAERLIAVARAHLPAHLQQKIDPEDVVQSAYRSFFAHARAGRYELQRGGDLQRLLVAITLHKLNDQRKYHAAAKRDAFAERHFGSEDSLFACHAEAFAREPTPLQALSVLETLDQLVQCLEPVGRRVVELRLQGCTLYEIAAETDSSIATVRRVLDQAKQVLTRGTA